MINDVQSLLMITDELRKSLLSFTCCSLGSFLNVPCMGQVPTKVLMILFIPPLGVEGFFPWSDRLKYECQTYILIRNLTGWLKMMLVYSECRHMVHK